MSLTSITVTGSQRAQFELDDLLALLFFATGHEFRKLEVQELADDQTIVSVTIPSSRPRQLVGHGYRLKDMVESSDMHEAFICLQRLPARARHFSRYHFRVLIHAMQVALQSPVQKTLIDLYQILDTVAGLHPKVSKTKEPQEAFDLRKQQQKVIVNAAQAIIKALKLIQSSEDVPVADALKGFEEIVHYQKNEPEAAKRIGMLLQAVGLPYSKGDKTAKKAIVSAAQAIIKAFKLIQSSEGVSAADALKGLEELINYQKNEPGVARRIRMLLLAVNLPYSEGDKTAKLALDLRNSISHDLASVRVKGDPDDDGYPLGDLLDVQGRLLMWAHLSLSNLLWMAREPAGATTAAPVSTEEPAASEDLKGK